MNDRLFPTRPILAVSAAVFRQGRVLLVLRARVPLLGDFSLPGVVVESAKRSPTRSRASLWKRSASGPKSSLLTGMWRQLSRREPNTDAFCHRFVRRPMDKGRAALERRSRRPRLDQPACRPTVADDAGARRSPSERRGLKFSAPESWPPRSALTPPRPSSHLQRPVLC
jgi:hypothetical protein